MKAEAAKTKRVALITGASGGIGRAAVQRFMQEGYTVYGLSRSKADLGGATYIPADVTDPESIRKAVEQVWVREGRIDVLVCNAGFGISGAVEFTDLEDARRQLDVNFFGAFLCAKAVLPYMRAQGFGRIINVSSVAATIAIPFQAFYSASKAALNALTLALANEVRGMNIQICALMPGDVKTGFTAARKKSTEGLDAYPRMQGTVAAMERDEQNGMAPEYIAGLLVRIARKRRPKPLYASGPRYGLILLLNRLLPARVVNYLVWKIYQ